MAASKNSSGTRVASANGTSAVTRVAIYARVSTSDQSTDVQVEVLRAEAAHRGFAVAGEYIDDGVSGVKVSRPALDRMLADVAAGQIDVVLVWKLDRLGRTLSGLLNLLDGFTASGVGFVSVNDAGIDTTTVTGRLLTQVLACFGSYERDLIKMRTEAGRERARRNGVHCGRPKVEMDLRPAVSMLKQGYGVKAIANALGVSRTTLRRRLREAGHLVGEQGDQNTPAEDVA
jgi:DNA invertase Pin-like site-specific DNA recombinase